MIKHYLTIILLLICYHSQAQWSQVGVDIDGDFQFDRLGYSVSLSSDGTIVAAGAFRYEPGEDYIGYARVFKNINDTWVQIGDDILAEEEGDWFGAAISLNSDGNIIALGAQENSGNGNRPGHVRIFENINGEWIQLGEDIDGEAAYDDFGYSISLNSTGNIIAVGAPDNDGNGNRSGHIRVFEYINGTWNKIGEDIDGEGSNDFSGWSVSLNSEGSIIAIGAIGNDANGDQAGHVRVYQNINETWLKIGEDIDGEYVNNHFGTSVSLNSEGSIVAIGAPGAGQGTLYGRVRIFENIGGLWSQIGNELLADNTYNRFGNSVSLNEDGLVLAVGAHADHEYPTYSGKVRVFKYYDGIWTQFGGDIYGEETSENFGMSVSLNSDGTVVSIGAPYNNVNGLDSGKVRVFENQLLGINELSYNEICIYPNPVQDILNIETQQQIETVKIYSLQGQLIKESSKSSLDVSQLTAGMYFAQVTIEGKTVTKKFIKE